MSVRDSLAVLRAALASALMFIAGAIAPVIGQLLMLAAPVPILGCAVGFRHALWRALAVTAVAGGLMVLVGGLIAGATYLAIIGSCAVAITYMLERRQPFERIILGASILMVSAGTAVALIFVGPPQLMAQALQAELMRGIANAEKAYGVIGLDLSLSADVRTNVVLTTIRLMPALLALSAALMVLVNLAIFWRISGRQQRIGYTLFGDLIRWSTPEWLIWMLLVTGFGLFIPLPPIRTAALDCFVCIAAIYFCQGLAIMAFYFRMLSMPVLARGLVYFITMLQPVLALLVCVAGIFDLWIDFRRLKPPSSEARNMGDFL